MRQTPDWKRAAYHAQNLRKASSWKVLQVICSAQIAERLKLEGPLDVTRAARF